jgi:hypothetical protein
LAGVAVLFAQFFGGAAGKFGDGFLQFVPPRMPLSSTKLSSKD